METHVVSNLDSDTTYWFALRAYDEMANYGGISNCPNEATAALDDTTPPSANDKFLLFKLYGPIPIIGYIGIALLIGTVVYVGKKREKGRSKVSKDSGVTLSPTHSTDPSSLSSQLLPSSTPQEFSQRQSNEILVPIEDSGQGIVRKDSGATSSPIHPLGPSILSAQSLPSPQVQKVPQEQSSDELIPIEDLEPNFDSFDAKKPGNSYLTVCLRHGI